MVLSSCQYSKSSTGNKEFLFESQDREMASSSDCGDMVEERTLDSGLSYFSSFRQEALMWSGGM